MSVRVIGCGNPDAGDDALGLLAVRAAHDRLPPDVEVVEAAVALHVLDLLDGADAAVVVDAVRTPRGTRDPGTLVRAEATIDGLPVDVRSSLSSHGFGLAEAVGLAAAVGPVPRLVFIGLEVGDVRIGESLSPAVSEAMPELVDTLVAEVLAARGAVA
jgi:hydrogenase maturation protease